MNTNILELATFAAIGVMTWFLVMMNNPSVGEMKKDDISSLVEEEKSNNRVLTLEQAGDLVEVTLGSGYSTDDGELKYRWNHTGSFSTKESNKEGIHLHDPIDHIFVFESDDNGHNGRWELRPMDPNWVSIDPPLYKGKWDTATITIKLGAGVHVFNCVVENQKTGALNKEGGETVVVIVEAPGVVETKDTNSGLYWVPTVVTPPVENVVPVEVGLLSK